MPNLRSEEPLFGSVAVRITVESLPFVAVKAVEEVVAVKLNGVSIVKLVAEPLTPFIVIRLRFTLIAGF